MHEPFRPHDYFIDGNGCLAERATLGDLEIVVHYDEIPETDMTVIDGLRCTTAVRSAIDVAGDLDLAEVTRLVRDSLEQGIFTPEEVFERVAKSDMLLRPGATRIAQALRDILDAA